MRKSKKPKVTIEEDEEVTSGWSKVQRYLNKKDINSLLLAVIEADKLLAEVLKDKGYPGKSTEEKIGAAKEKFTNINFLLGARDIRDKIINKIDYNLTSLDLEDAISAYRQAMIDLGEESEKLPISERIILYFDYYFPSKKQALKKVLIYIVLFFTLVWFLAHTSSGQSIVKAVVGITNIIFSWVLAVILLIVGVIITAIVSLLYFEKRRRERR
jgi:hypothetical protein